MILRKYLGLAIGALAVLLAGRTLGAAAPAAASEPAVLTAEETAYYRELYERYRKIILPDAKAGDSVTVTHQTETFNQSLGGKLLHVRVTRIEGDKYTNVVNLNLSKGDVPLPAIKYADESQVHVSRMGGAILIESNHLPDGAVNPATGFVGVPRYADDVYVSMTVTAVAAAKQVDAAMAKQADLVLRVQRTDAPGGSHGNNVTEVASVIEVLLSGGSQQGPTISISHDKDSPGLPAEECTVYLKEHRDMLATPGKEITEVMVLWWGLLGDSAKTGVSHVGAATRP